jgi:uncharacterized membrane-anchored protein
MQKLKNFAREQVILMTVAFISFSTQPAIVWAQDVNPLPFTEPLSVSRGSVTPASKGAIYLTPQDACTIATYDWGWESCDSLDAVIWSQLPDIDTTVIEKPDTSGYVSFDDWDGDEKDDVIADIEETLRVGLAEQGRALGTDISFTGWSVYPTLNTDKQMMYYATNAMWGGRQNVNIEATVFDRRGYVRFKIVPVATEVTPVEVEAMITKALAQYQPATGESYAAFTSSDKIAAVGAVGVLAGLAGLQYGKGAATGIFAVALLILKKAWFLLLLPFIWLKGLFSRKKGS